MYSGRFGSYFDCVGWLSPEALSQKTRHTTPLIRARTRDTPDRFLDGLGRCVQTLERLDLLRAGAGHGARDAFLGFLEPGSGESGEARAGYDFMSTYCTLGDPSPPAPLPRRRRESRQSETRSRSEHDGARSSGFALCFR